MNETLPMEGPATDEVMLLTAFLMEGVAHYIENNKTDRRVLIAALSEIFKFVFSDQTPLNLKEQCYEIDEFCNHLKRHAMRHAVKE